MKIRNAPYTECDACGKPIYAGNATVSFNRNIEQLEHTPSHPGGIITVIDSEELITLCGDCGNKFSVERAREILKTVLNQPAYTRN